MIEFQSGHPVRGATRPQRPRKALCPNFNPRAPCGARRDRRCGDHARADISIHAPRVGRDVQILGRVVELRAFQSTRPVWGATTIVRRPGNTTRFQSTRPVWGATCGSVTSGTSYPLFQSTRPVWGATMKKAKKAMCNVFQFTRPVWGATLCTALVLRARHRISIPAPRVGRDTVSA